MQATIRRVLKGAFQLIPYTFSLCVNTTCQSPHHICASLKRYGHSLCQQCPKNYALYINTLSGLSLSNCCLKCSNQTVSNKHGGNTVRKWVVSRRYALIAELKGEASNCDALSFRVGMYVYPQLAQCNSMLVYVYLQRLRNTILCSRMYICHACTTIVRFSYQNVPRGRLRPWTTAWPAWPYLFYGFKDRWVCQCVQLVYVKSCSSQALAF